MALLISINNAVTRYTFTKIMSSAVDVSVFFLIPAYPQLHTRTTSSKYTPGLHPANMDVVLVLDICWTTNVQFRQCPPARFSQDSFVSFFHILSFPASSLAWICTPGGQRKERRKERRHCRDRSRIQTCVCVYQWVYFIYSLLTPHIPLSQEWSGLQSLCFPIRMIKH